MSASLGALKLSRAGKTAITGINSLTFGGSSMPKEQPCSSEHSHCAPSSKTAKDKSNSTTLMAIRNTKEADDYGGRGSRCSSEKDSGYSDASDWQQTDVEDQLSNKSRSSGSKHAETSGPGQNQEVGQGNPANPPLMPAGHQLTPVYIINNMVLKQPEMIPKRAELPQRDGFREKGSSGPAHMILLQQPSLLLATLQLHKPSSRKSSATGKKTNGTYQPILNSYPRIAPHPSKKPPDKSSSIDESQNLSKRMCTERKSGDTSVSLPEQHLNKQPKLAVLTSGQPVSSSTRDSQSSSSPTPVSSCQGSPSVSSSLPTRGSHRSSSATTRHRRFLNTVEILRQSGLLDITLRTKELLRQSNTTERDIAQLRQHTKLLCQAASNPTLNGLTAWEHVHQTMAESGSYPGLKFLQSLQLSHSSDPASQPESISTGDTKGVLATEKSEVQLSHFVTSIPEPSQNRPVPEQSHSGEGRELEPRYKSSERVTSMPPDSSTG